MRYFLNNGPVYLRLGKAGEPILSENADDEFHFGKIRKLQSGARICILGYGPILSKAFDAANLWKANTDEQVAIYSVHTLKPLDSIGIKNVLMSYDTIIVVEEHVPSGSLGQQVKQLAWDARAKCRIHTISLQDKFIHCYGNHDDLLAAHGITGERIFACFE